MIQALQLAGNTVCPHVASLSTGTTAQGTTTSPPVLQSDCPSNSYRLSEAPEKTYLKQNMTCQPK